MAIESTWQSDNRNTQHPILGPMTTPAGAYPYAGDKELPPKGTLEKFLARMRTTEAIGAPKETTPQPTKFHIPVQGLDYDHGGNLEGIADHPKYKGNHDVLIQEPSISLEYQGEAYVNQTETGATEFRVNMSDPDGSLEVTQHTMRHPDDNKTGYVEKHFNSLDVPSDATYHPNPYKSPSPYYEDPNVARTT